ncbi:hypothetical protein JHK84_043053 [Glycine max]|nr:hypothetical protein JHK84_043053 [Glycine max]
MSKEMSQQTKDYVDPPPAPLIDLAEIKLYSPSTEPSLSSLSPHFSSYTSPSPLSLATKKKNRTMRRRWPSQLRMGLRWHDLCPHLLHPLYGNNNWKRPTITVIFVYIILTPFAPVPEVLAAATFTFESSFMQLPPMQKWVCLFVPSCSDNLKGKEDGDETDDELEMPNLITDGLQGVQSRFISGREGSRGGSSVLVTMEVSGYSSHAARVMEDTQREVVSSNPQKGRS